MLNYFLQTNSSNVISSFVWYSRLSNCEQKNMPTINYRPLDLRMNYVTRVNTVMGVVKKEISSMDGKLLWSTNGLKQKASYSKESAAHCTKSVL